MNSLLKRVTAGFFTFFLMSEYQENTFRNPLIVLAATSAGNIDVLSEELDSAINLDIRNWLSDDARYIFDSVDKKIFDDEMYRELKSINKHFEDIYFSKEERMRLSDLSVLNLLIEKNAIRSSMNDAKKIVNDIEVKYLSDMGKRYEGNKEHYDSMVKKSYEFKSQGKLTDYCSPESVMIATPDKILNDFPIVYNNCILISLEDMANLTGKNHEIEYMKSNSNVIVKFGKNIIEIEPGESKIHINDTSKILDNPVLSYGNHKFVSTDIFNYLDDFMNNEVLRAVRIVSDNSNEPKVVIF